MDLKIEFNSFETCQLNCKNMKFGFNNNQEEICLKT